MKTLLLVFAFAALASANPQPHTLSLTGTLTNTTVDVAARALLEITLDGEKLTAQLVTLPPLTGSGRLTGRCLDGWCELSGSLDGGYTVNFRGVLNAHTFRGTYVAIPNEGRTQYGRFEFSPAALATK